MDLIRSVEVTDLAAVSRIERQTYGSDGYPSFFFRQAYELFRETFFVACDGGQIIGYCLGALAVPKKRTGWILSICVKPDYRNQGYGSKRVCLPSYHLPPNIRLLRHRDCNILS